MKIAIVAPFEESVPPTSYGGTELVIHNLTEELVSMGHEVSLIATGDSKTNAHLIEVFPKSLRSDNKMIKFRERYKYIGTGKVMDILKANKFDIVHNNLGWRLLPFSNFISSPLMTTLHGPLTTEEQRICYTPFLDSNYVSISKNQQKGMPELNFIANVYNGIDVDKFTMGPKERTYLSFLGRMSPEKGAVQAIQIAKASGKKLIMAAKIDAVDENYFNSEVKPLIDNQQIVFIGEVNHSQKVEFLKNSSALLMPIRWEEPFGLVNIEALACGTPVIGLARGSLPEIIRDEETGFLCSSIEEMVQKVAKIETLNPDMCRKEVEERFTSTVMASNYLNVYNKVLNR